MAEPAHDPSASDRPEPGDTAAAPEPPQLPPVGPTTVPEAEPDLEPVVAGDAVVLVDRRFRRAHQVNHTAAAVFAMCDGTQDVAALTAELAELYAVPVADIADTVIETIEQYRALGLVAVDGSHRPVPDEPDPGERHVPAPCSPCQANIDGYGWEPTLAVAVGDVVLGVRANDAAATARVRERLADRVVDDPDVPANFSVVLLDGLPDDDGPLRRSGLYESHLWLTGDLDHDGILDLLERRLAQYEPRTDRQVRFAANVLVGDLGAVLLPWEWRFPDQRTAEVAAARGWRVLAAPATVTVADDGPPTVAVDGTTVALRGVVTGAAETARLEGPEAVTTLVVLLTGRGRATVAEVQLLPALAGHVAVVATSVDKLADVAGALVRAR